MATQENSTVVGVFADHEKARSATRALRDAGFTEDQIGVASSNRAATNATGGGDDDDGSYTGEGAMAGAATGAATGAGIGALWGLGILAGVLPAIGPAIAGGTLAVLLSSAAAGAAAAGLAGALIGLGFSKEEADYYEGEMKSGRTIVTVKAAGRREEALRILRQFGGYDMASRSSHQHSVSTPQAGSITHGTDESTVACNLHTGKHAVDASAARVPKDTIQAREERLKVDKDTVEKGEVTVRKETHTEHKTLDVPVTREEVVIERRSGKGQAARAGELGAGEEIRIPVREEQVNVEKQTVVAEEVSVGKRRVRDTQHVDETLRKEEIKIENEGNASIRDKRS